MRGDDSHHITPGGPCREAELSVESLADGGDGVAHFQGRTVFVPLTLPGEVVRASVPEWRAGVTAALVEVVRPSSERRPAACPLYGECGGCQWLHASEDVQRSWKTGRVRRVFSQTMGETCPEIPPVEEVPPVLGYRRRTVLHAADGILGFSARRSHRVTEPGGCLLLEEPLRLAVREMAAAVKSGMQLPRGCADVSLAGDGSRTAAAFHFERRPPADALARLTALTRHTGIAGAVICVGGAAVGTIGKPLLRWPAPGVPGASLLGRPDLFAQAHLRAGELLAGIAAEAIPEGDRVLELFGGSGTLTLAASRRAASVTSVEICSPALTLARKAADEAGITNVRFQAGDSLRTAGHLAAGGERFGTVLLDPPRAGAKGIAQAALAVGARRVVYVSCNPATLALDAAALRRTGFELTSIRCLDLFPQTAHLEAAAVFQRGESGSSDGALHDR